MQKMCFLNVEESRQLFVTIFYNLLVLWGLLLGKGKTSQFPCPKCNGLQCDCIIFCQYRKMSNCEQATSNSVFQKCGSHMFCCSQLYTVPQGILLRVEDYELRPQQIAFLNAGMQSLLFLFLCKLHSYVSSCHYGGSRSTSFSI